MNSRRNFVKAAATAALTLPFASRIGAAAPSRSVVFDGLALFDARVVAKAAAEVFGARADTFMGVWRSKLFEYQWLSTLADKHLDFADCLDRSLAFALKSVGFDGPQTVISSLRSIWDALPLWPDVASTVSQLQRNGVTLSVLSNMTEPMLLDGLARGGVRNVFSHVISTDAVGKHKPHASAYQAAVNATGTDVSATVFVAFAGWDVAGAKWFGFPTYWVNRLGFQEERLGEQADWVEPDLAKLLSVSAE